MRTTVLTHTRGMLCLCTYDTPPPQQDTADIPYTRTPMYVESERVRETHGHTIYPVDHRMFRRNLLDNQIYCK
jgi:hypothetical protein